MGAFNLGDSLAAALKVNVSKSDTAAGREQIEYIDLTALDADENNFYALDGLDELAANIELVGLQQPLRVRPNPDMPGRYFIVSGHRRRAALSALVEEGREDLREAPCIVEQPAASAALQELRLIYANSGTRKISAADLSKQAERVEMLLYQLKEEGYDFPGRMRDHVAAACKVAPTKLATLKKIREHLIPEYMSLFEKNQLPEATAYALARLPEEFQSRMARVLTKIPNGYAVENVLEKYKEGWRWEPEFQCSEGKPCPRGDTFLRRDCEVPTWQGLCGGKTCCLKCDKAKTSCYPCDRMCSKAKAQRKDDKAKADEANHKQMQKRGRPYQKKTQGYAKRLLRAIDAAGLAENTKIRWRQYYGAVYPVSTIRQWAAGEFDDPAGWYSAKLLPEECDSAPELARLLGCSTDFLLGLTDDLRPGAVPEEPDQEDATEENETDTSAETQEDISEILNKISQEEPHVRRIRWENRGQTPPEGIPILAYQLTNIGAQYRPAVWDGSQFRSPDGRKELTGLFFTHWLEVPLPGSGETVEVALADPPPDGGARWRPGDQPPEEDCDAACIFRIDDTRIRQIAQFYNGRWHFSGGATIDAGCLWWFPLPKDPKET